MTDIELLSSILTKTGDLIDGVRADQLALPTPCTEYDVAALRSHIVGWVQAFAAGSTETDFEGDPGAFLAGDDAVAVFRAAADQVVAGWSEHGFDRNVKVMSGAEMPGTMIFNMTAMEYFTHGWDLATATGQTIPFTNDEAAAVLERARQTLPAEYRGPQFGFADEVDVPEDAPAIDRMIAFMGRTP